MHLLVEKKKVTKETSESVHVHLFPLLKLTVSFHHQNMRHVVSAALICCTPFPEDMSRFPGMLV